MSSPINQLSRGLRALRRRRRLRRAREELISATRLNLGCGSHPMEGWANLDMGGGPNVVAFDLTDPLPVAEGSVEFVYSEHFIEHIDAAAGMKLLGECHRVLRRGGVVRLSTPDLRVMVDEYHANRLHEWVDMGWEPATSCRLLNEGMRLWGHQFLYDEGELSGALSTVGFSVVKRVAWRDSEHDALRGLETRPFHRDLILEAVK